MTRMTYFVFIAVFSSLSWPALAAVEIDHWETKGGTRVLFMQAPELPMVDFRVVFDAGSSRDGKIPGLAQMVSALLEEGADGKDADWIANQFESLGAEFGAGSERDMAQVSLRSLTDTKLLEPAVELFSKVLSKPDFPGQAFERERGRALIALQADEQSPGTVASKAFYAEIYGDHPYSSPVAGTRDSLNKLDVDDLKGFHRKYYVSGNAVLAIVGDLAPEEARLFSEKIMAGLPEGQQAKKLGAVGKTKSRLKQISFPSQQSHILMGLPGMSRGDPDYFTLYVGNHILGGSGLVSRISEEIRESRGLAYSAYSYFHPMRQPGPFTIGMQTRNEKLDEAIQVLRELLDDFIEKGPTEKELNDSISNITGGFPLRVSSNGKMVGYLSMIGFYGLPLDYLDTFTDKVSAVRAQDITDAFRRRVKPDEIVTVVVGGES